MDHKTTGRHLGVVHLRPRFMMDRCTLISGLVLTRPLHIESFSTPLLTSRIPRALDRDDGANYRRRRRRNAPRVELAAGGTYLDSLSSIAENHHLFPQTSNALDALQGGARDASSMVSPQEFLTSLSSELSRASEDYSSGGVQAYEISSPSLTTTQDPSSFLQGLAEQFAPAATSIAGVGYAADRHSNSDYSSVPGSSQWDYYDGQSGGDSMDGTSPGYESNGFPDAGQASGAGMQQQEDIGQVFDHTTGDHATNAASTAFTEATNSAHYGGSTAAWNPEGSHPLQDLASSMSPDQAGVQNMASQYDASNFATSASTASEVNDYFGLGDAFHRPAENADSFDQMAQFVALDPKMSAPQIKLEGGSLGSIEKAPTAFEWTRSKFEAASAAVNDGTFASSMDQALSAAKQAGESSKQTLNGLLESNPLSDLGSTVEGIVSSSKQGSLADTNVLSSLGSTMEGALSSAKDFAADSSTREKLSGLIESMAGSAGALGSQVSEATSKAFDGSTYSDLQPPKPKLSQGTFGIPKSPRMADAAPPVPDDGGYVQPPPSNTLSSGPELSTESPDKWIISSEDLAGKNDVLPDTPLTEQQSRVQPPVEVATPSEVTSQVSPSTDFKSEASLGQDVLPSTSVDTPTISDTEQLTTPTPQIESPPLPKPDALSLDTSDFGAASLPKVELQPPDAPSLPKADTLPEVSTPIEIRPPGQLQRVEPSLPSNSNQGLPVPDLKTDAVPLPEIDIPTHPSTSHMEVEIPSVPKFDFHPPKIPDFEAPSIPKFEVDVPKMPSLNIRPPRMPELNLRRPLPQDAVPTPQIPKVVTGMEVPQSSDFQPSISNAAIQTHTDFNPSASLDSSVSAFGDASLSDFGHAVVSSLQYIGEIFVKVIDSILNLVAGTSIEATLVAIQTSISATIDSASHSVVSTLNAIGDISIRDVFNGILTLILMIGDILMKATNAAVYLVSGKGEKLLIYESDLMVSFTRQLHS